MNSCIESLYTYQEISVTACEPDKFINKTVKKTDLSVRKQFYDFVHRALDCVHIGPPVEMARCLKKELCYILKRDICIWTIKCYQHIKMCFDRQGLLVSKYSKSFEDAKHDMRGHLRVMSPQLIDLVMYRKHPDKGRFPEKYFGRGSHKIVYRSHAICINKDRKWQHIPTVALYFYKNILEDSQYIQSHNIQKQLSKEGVLGIPKTIHHVEKRIGIQERYDFSLHQLFHFQKQQTDPAISLSYKRQLIECISSILQIVKDLHVHKAIHRDIKMDNCLIRQQGDYLTTVLGDLDFLETEIGFTVDYEEPFPINYAYWDMCSAYGVVTELVDWLGVSIMLLISVTEKVTERDVFLVQYRINDRVEKHQTDDISAQNMYPYAWESTSSEEKACWVAFFQIAYQSSLLLCILRSLNHTFTHISKKLEKDWIIKVREVQKAVFPDPPQILQENINLILKAIKIREKKLAEPVQCK